MKDRYPSELRRRRTVSWSEACLLLELDDVGFAEWLRDEFAHAGSDARLLPCLDVPFPGVPARISYSMESTEGYSLLLRTAEHWRNCGAVSSLKRRNLRGVEERSNSPSDVLPPEGRMHDVTWIKRDELSQSVLLDSTLTGRVFLTPETVQEAIRCDLELTTIFAAPLQWQGKNPAWPLCFIFEAGGAIPDSLKDPMIRFAVGDLHRAKAKIDGRKLQPSDVEESLSEKRSKSFDREREVLHWLICGLIELAGRTESVPPHRINGELSRMFQFLPELKMSESTVRNRLKSATDTAGQMRAVLAQGRRKIRR